MHKTFYRLKAFFALTLSLVMLATSMLVWRGETAYAAEQETEYEKLYYISDYTGSQEYVDNQIPDYLSEVGLGEEDIEYIYFEAADFIDNVVKLYDEKYFMNIRNAYVIFEMRQEYPIEEDLNDGNLFVYKLKDIFSSLKERNCKIMIIFGTDEMALAGKPEYTEFLTYADVVINTNVMYTFMYNYIYWVNEIYHATVYDANVLVSPSLCDDSGQIEPKYGMFSLYLIPYCREIFGIDNIYTNKQVFNRYFLPNNHYIGWEKYSHPYDWGFLNNLGSPIGLGTADGVFYSQWEKTMYEFRQILGDDLPIFILNESGANVAEWIVNGTKDDRIFYSGDIKAILDHYVPLIMYGFIVGEDLTQYANWPGACPITFKPIFMGDGWMNFPIVIEDWQRIVEEKYPWEE